MIITATCRCPCPCTSKFFCFFFNGGRWSYARADLSAGPVRCIWPMYESIMGVVHYVVGFQSEKEVVDLLGWDAAKINKYIFILSLTHRLCYTHWLVEHVSIQTCSCPQNGINWIPSFDARHAHRPSQEAGWVRWWFVAVLALARGASCWCCCHDRLIDHGHALLESDRRSKMVYLYPRVEPGTSLRDKHRRQQRTW